MTFFALLLGLALSAGAQPARIIVIRHAEKTENPDDPHLSVEGQVRAERLVRWLAQGKVLGTNGPPAALFAPSPGRRGYSVRCLETLQPTARKLGVPVHALYRQTDYDLQAQHLLRDKSLRGKNVVVCWPHEYLPHLAAALGISPPPPKWKSEDFESAYVITFPKGRATLEKTKERLKKD